MRTLLVELLRVLSPVQRRRLLRLQLLVVAAAVAEIAGVAAFAPFMALVGDAGRLEGEGRLAALYRASGIAAPGEFLFWSGLAVLALVVVAGLLSGFAMWRLSLYGAHVGAELSTRVFGHYLHQSWLFHVGGNSSELTERTAQECQRVTVAVINPLMQMNARAVMAVLLLLALLLFNPLLALGASGLFVTLYALLYGTVRRRLAANGRAVSEAQTQRFRLMGEAFGGIKELLLLGAQANYVERFAQESGRYAEGYGNNQALGKVPRYAVEVVAFGSVIVLVLLLLRSGPGPGDILPLLAVYALAGMKLLPAFQQIYANLAQVRGHLSAFEAIRGDLRAAARAVAAPAPTGRLVAKSTIVLRDVTFSYPGKPKPVLDALSLTIPVRSTVCIAGPSGAGKSTLIDLLMGLLEPATGEVLIDGVPLTAANRGAWQNSIGLVPQTIFLADATIRENIAFGLPRAAIDDRRVREAAVMARLDEWLRELPAGLDTPVGERGVQISGGQRQRVGIARALYRGAELLVFDEATNALDSLTERSVMAAIQGLTGEKTVVIIAHRLATVRGCDQIFLMNDGRLAAQGCYAELLQRSELFKRMAAPI